LVHSAQPEAHPILTETTLEHQSIFIQDQRMMTKAIKPSHQANSAGNCTATLSNLGEWGYAVAIADNPKRSLPKNQTLHPKRGT
jgi:hypothetical protein